MLLQQMLSPLGRALKKTVQYLLRDEFTTEEAAPITTPRTCEPGPGSLTIVDTENKISISGGQLHILSNVTPAWIHGFYSNAIARAAGVAVYIGFKNISGVQIVPLCLFSTQIVTTPASASNIHGSYVVTNSLNLYVNGQAGNGFTTGITLSVGVNYQLLWILRSSGVFCFLKGGVYTDWILIHITTVSSIATLYAMAVANRSTVDFDNLSVRQLSAPYDNEASWRTSQLLNPIVGATTTHVANTVVEFAWTFDGATVVDVAFRQTDVTHNWHIYAGGTQCNFYERNGAGYVNRAVYYWPAAISAGTVVYIAVVADGNTYRGYVYIAAHGYKYMWTYTDAGNNSINATQAEVIGVSGGISEINFFPSRPELPI